MLIFWVTDNFLMRHNRKLSGVVSRPTLLQRVKIRYQSLRMKSRDESESDALISGDDELLGSVSHRKHSLHTVGTSQA